MPDLTKDAYLAGANAFLAANSDRLTLCGLNHLYYARGLVAAGYGEPVHGFRGEPRLHRKKKMFEALTELLLRIVERAATFHFDGIDCG